MKSEHSNVGRKYLESRRIHRQKEGPCKQKPLICGFIVRLRLQFSTQFFYMLMDSLKHVTLFLEKQI